MKRALSLVLALCMVFTLAGTAFAADYGTKDSSEGASKNITISFTATGSNETVSAITKTATRLSGAVDSGVWAYTVTAADINAINANKPAPTDTTKEFDKWYVSGKTAELAAGDVLYSDITLAAQWKDKTETPPEKFDVTFQYADNTTADKVVSVEKGQKVAKPADPTRQGFKFLGWYNGDTKFDFSTPITGAVTLTAKWEADPKPNPKSFDVTFKYDDGTTADKVVSVEEGKTVTAPTDPTRKGHKFLGWFNGNTKFDFNTAITGAVTLTAKWEAIKYTVTFMSNGKVYTTATVDYETTVSKPSNPSAPSGKVFAGWTEDQAADENSTKYDFSSKVTSDLTLYAIWKQDKISESIDTLKDPDKASPEELKDALDEIQSVDNESIKDSQLEELIKKEDAIADKLGIKVDKTPSVSNDVPAEAKAAAKGIKPEGLALSADPKSTVALKVDKAPDAPATPEEATNVIESLLPSDQKIVVPENAKEPVAIDISITVDGKTTELKAPLKLTIPLPAGFARGKTLIIHQASTGTEVIEPSYNSNNEAVIIVRSLSPFVFVEGTIEAKDSNDPSPNPDNGNNNGWITRPTGGGSHSGQSSGGSGGGKGKSSIAKTTLNTILGMNKAVVTTPASKPVTSAEATKAVNAAISTASAKNSKTAEVRFVNATVIPAQVLANIAATAKKSGMNAIIHADTLVNGVVVTRLYIDPAQYKLTGDLQLSAVIDPKDIKAKFDKYFSSNVQIVSLSQEGSLGMEVSVAAKINTTGMNVKNLKFYSYDAKTNKYQPITMTNCFIDNVGYLHFTTTTGGNIVISGTALA